ncbi:hypothetical protein HPB50_009964 [Hyalomma asiaticum]|uniref:Uncharacterized protein n=1 Tax=Hyalomma asiaticum TaxID=266040 RepID=A0ACB7S1X5_HYAAI|nr:hypothetical protein HPB50_009964 [Hyalomma asiaticum]
MRTYCSLLEVPRNASPEDILLTYRQLAMGRLPDKSPNKAEEGEARFMKISEPYEVPPSGSKSPQDDFHGRGGKDTGHQADFATSQGPNAYNTDGAFTSTHRDPDQLFRELFGCGDPFHDVFRGMHGSQCGPRMLTGGFPLYQQNSGSTFRTDLFVDSDNLPLAPRLSLYGVDGSSARFVAMPPTQQESLLCYVNGKRTETRTIIRDGLTTALCFEDGHLVSNTVEQAVYELTPEASPGSSREMPPYRQRRDGPDFCAPSLFGGCVSAQPSSTRKDLYQRNSGAPAGTRSAKMSLVGPALPVVHHPHL